MNMEYVYVVYHSYENYDCDEIKTIGVYSSEKNAIIVVEKYKQLAGFKDYPDGFHISKYKVDTDNWTSGFIKWKDIP